MNKRLRLTQDHVRRAHREVPEAVVEPELRSVPLRPDSEPAFCPRPVVRETLVVVGEHEHDVVPGGLQSPDPPHGRARKGMQELDLLDRSSHDVPLGEPGEGSLSTNLGRPWPSMQEAPADEQLEIDAHHATYGRVGPHLHR